MAGTKTNSFGAMMKTLFSASLYKPELGRMARRCTFAGLAVLFLASGAATYYQHLYQNVTTNAIVAAATFLIGLWISFRAVNYPTFADFLISVETEMRKVSWPGKKELWQTTRVVLIFMALFIVMIYLYDVFFTSFFRVLDLALRSIGLVS